VFVFNSLIFRIFKVERPKPTYLLPLYGASNSRHLSRESPYAKCPTINALTRRINKTHAYLISSTGTVRGFSKNWATFEPEKFPLNRRTGQCKRSGQPLSWYLTNLMHKFLFYNKFIICLYMFRAICAHHQEVKNVLYSIWYRHNCRWPSGAQVERGLYNAILTP